MCGRRPYPVPRAGHSPPHRCALRRHSSYRRGKCGRDGICLALARAILDSRGYFARYSSSGLCSLHICAIRGDWDRVPQYRAADTASGARICSFARLSVPLTDLFSHYFTRLLWRFLITRSGAHIVGHELCTQASVAEAVDALDAVFLHSRQHLNFCGKLSIWKCSPQCVR